MLKARVQGGKPMYTDTMVIASIAVIGGIFLFAGCFALFIWLDAANDEDSSEKH